MKKRVVVGFIFLLLLTACAKEETPAERLSHYIDLWTDENWTAMYEEYITHDAKEAFGKEQFIERTEKYYTDLGIESVEIDFKKPEEKQKYNKEDHVQFPISIKMDTIAGEVAFEKDVSFVYEMQNEEKNWFLQWDPSFILPELEKDDKVGIVKISAERGEIYDRDEKPLAINGSGAQIGVVAGNFNEETDAAKLADVLKTTPDFIRQQLNQSWVEEGHFVPIKKLPFTQQNQYEEALQIAGVTTTKVDMREYPYAEALAHLIGYTGQINADELKELQKAGYTEEDIVGKRGLEQLLEERLRGENGIEIYIEKSSDTEERITIAEQAAVNGETVTLTIDADFQQTIYNEMNQEPGTAAVVDPETGETLALVSSPAFDPNEFALGVTSERYTALTEDSSEPLLNRFSTIYAPGSAIKPITAAIGMEAGTLIPTEGHTITGKRWQKDKSWGDFKVTRVYDTPNPVNLKKALIYSDNIYFAKEALKLKQENLIEGLMRYGFDEKIPYKYPLRSSQISNNGQIESEGQLVDTSFGQGQMLMNILHLASTYEAILNDGKMIQPILFADEEKGETWKENLLSVEHATILKEDLRAVVTDGFAEEANKSALKISGKTGTAELKQSAGERGKENGFFVGYPTETENYIIAMMIEDVQHKGGSSYVAGKVAKVMEKK